jgi:virginiamycin B lyase
MLDWDRWTRALLASAFALSLPASWSSAAAAEIAPLRWSRVPGAASRLAVAPDGTLWALATTPDGANKFVLHQTGAKWSLVPGLLASSIAVDSFGIVYVSNTPGGIFSYDGKKWSARGGAGLTDVATGLTTLPQSDLVTSVFALGPAGKNGNRQIYELNPARGGQWVSDLYGVAFGTGIQVAESPLDLNTYAIPGVGLAAPLGAFYSVASDGAIAFTAGRAKRLPARATAVALVPGGYVGLSYPASARGESVYYCDFATGKTTPQAGTAVSLAAGRGPGGTGTRILSLDAAGRIWSASVVPVDPSFTELPGAGIGYGSEGEESVARGRDGALWFSGAPDALGRIATDGTVTRYPLRGNAAVGQIVAGPDGDIWFAASNGIGRASPAGTVTEYSVNTTEGTPYGIAAGSDGALWFTLQSPPYNGLIGRITTGGIVKEYQLPGPHGFAWPNLPGSIAAGADGALWFTQNVTGQIGRITTSGKISYYMVPSGNPWDITAGPDGALWFTAGPDESEGGGTSQVGRIATSGKVTEYAIPSGSVPDRITTGPDGALWFSEYLPYGASYGSGRLGRITTAGKVTEYPILTLSGPAKPTGIAAGPDGALWFMDGANIVRRK